MKLPHPGSLSVDPASGNLAYVADDLSIPCRGRVAMDIRRFYNSNNDHPSGGLLCGWTFNFDERLAFEFVTTPDDLAQLEDDEGDDEDDGQDANQNPHVFDWLDFPEWADHVVVPDPDAPFPHLRAVTVRYPDGSQHRFEKDLLGPPGFHPVLPGVRRTLTFNPDRTWTLGVPGFGFHLFNEGGKLIAVEDAFGNRVRYDWEHVGLKTPDLVDHPQLVAMTDPVGRSLRLSYSLYPAKGEMHFRRTIRDWTGREWHYDVLRMNAFIHAYVDPEGNITRYHRGGPEHPLFPPPRGLSIPALPGVEPPNVSSALLGLHKIEFPNGDYVINYTGGARPMSKRVGVQIFGDRLAVNHIYDVEGRRTTRLVGTADNAYFYEFNEDFALVRTVDPMGNEYRYEYDAKGRISATVDPKLSRSTYQYDERDNLTRITDPLGNSTSYEYDPVLNEAVKITGPGSDAPTYSYEYHRVSGVLLSQTDPMGHKTRFEYDVRGRMTAMIGPLGDRHGYLYSETGELMSQTDPLGNITRFEYDSLGRVLRSTSPEGRSTRFTYDRMDRVLSVTDPAGAVTAVQYDAHGNPVAVTAPTGSRTRFEFNPLNELVKVVDPLGQATTLTYDREGRLVQSLDPAGRKVRHEYDLLGRLISRTYPGGAKELFEHERYCGDLKTTDPLGRKSVLHRDVLCRATEVERPDGGRVRTAYNDEGYVDRVTDPLNQVTRFVYDRLGRVVEVVDALGQKEIRSFDAAGNLLSVTDRKGRTARFEYDLAHRLKRVLRRTGSSVEFSYNSDGQLAKVKDARGHLWRFRYDKAGRMVASTNPLGIDNVRIAYDAAGRVRERVTALGRKVSFEYDALDRLVAVTDPLGNRSTRTYDEKTGTLSSLTDPKGRGVYLQYDPLNRLVAVTDPSGGTVRRVLDAVGNLVSILDQNGTRTAYEYDPMDRVTAEVYADGSRLEWRYDLAGNLVQQKDPRGFVTGFVYDALHRLSRMLYADNPDAEFGYDANGNLVRRSDGTGTYLFEHDAEDRVVAFTQGSGSRYRVERDAEGNQTALIYPDGTRQRTEFDSAGRVSSLLTSDGGRTSFLYDAEDRRTRIDRPNGTYTLYDYDQNSRLSRLAHLRSNGEKITPDFRTSYDAVGNVLSVKDEEVMLWSYDYDELDRLVEAIDHASGKTWGWSYDPVGNRISETLDGVATASTFNNLNQLQQMGETRYWYDQAGNLAYKSTPTGSSAYRFDSQNRMIGVNTTDGQELTYTYDSGGRMIDADGASYEWQGWRPLTNGRDQLNGATDILQIGPLAERAYLHADHLGSIISASNADGSTIYTTKYSAWGESDRENTNPGFSGSLGVLTPLPGLVYVRSRWYDPKTGRFLSRDQKVTLNRYAYVGSSPIRFVDPLGQDRFPPDFNWDFRDVELDQGNGTAGQVSVRNTPRIMTPEQGLAAGNDLALNTAAMYVEPLDWYLLYSDIRQNGLQWSHTLAVLPFLTAAMVIGRPRPRPEPIVQTPFSPPDGCPTTLYHYTTPEGLEGIIETQSLRPSRGAQSARYGNGQYFTDLSPEWAAENGIHRLAHQLYRDARKITPLQTFVEVSVEGLQILQGRAHTFVHLSEEALLLEGRIVRSGSTPGHPRNR